jgi:hypothetical protein
MEATGTRTWRRPGQQLPELAGRLPAALRGPKATFAWHFAQMYLAMTVGMIVLAIPTHPLIGPVQSLAPSLCGHCLVMGVNMTIGMAAWMGYRHHAWERIAEMSLGMFGPIVALQGAAVAGLLRLGLACSLMDVAMLAGMLAAMLARYREYAGGHHCH